MVKNPPVNAGDMGSVLGLVQEDFMCCRATKPMCHNYQSPKALEPMLCNKKSLQWEAQAPQLESGPRSLQLEKASAQQWRPNAAKNAFNLKKF